jgi:hypothetical protein
MERVDPSFNLDMMHLDLLLKTSKMVVRFKCGSCESPQHSSFFNLDKKCALCSKPPKWSFDLNVVPVSLLSTLF